MKLFRVTLLICEGCLDGVGQECHTAGCAYFLHAVDLPLARELLEACEEIAL